MRNRDKWRPGKYVHRRGRLAASRDTKEVMAGSRLAAQLIADFYHDSLPQHARGRLLDLGCGNVPLYEAYKDHIDDNVCVDWAGTLHRNEYLDCECDLTKQLPFREGEFDTIILSDVLEHIPVPELLWQEMNRVLAPKGRVILNVPFSYMLHEEPHDYYRYTGHALRRFAEQAGFRVVLLKPSGGSPEIVADILAKHMQFLPLAGRLLAHAIQYLTYVFVRTSPGKKLSGKTAGKFPFGYFMVAEKEG